MFSPIMALFVSSRCCGGNGDDMVVRKRRSGLTLDQLSLLAAQRKAERNKHQSIEEKEEEKKIEEEEEETEEEEEETEEEEEEKEMEEEEEAEDEETVEVEEEEMEAEEEEEKEEEDAVKEEEMEDVLPILTHSHFHIGQPVSRQLPSWVTECEIVEEDIAAYSVPLTSSFLPSLLLQNLTKMGIVSLFPVQTHVVSYLLKTSSLIHDSSIPHPRDVCVCAPTGCGKTLCYVLPIVASLIGRVVCRLRALVIVPSQQLAEQVKLVFDGVVRGTGLRVGVVCGRRPVEEEEDLLVDVGSVPPCSGVDVLVATPGRLTHHLFHTPFLSLAHLCYLVIDEADRLFEQHYHGWLHAVLDQTNCSPEPQSLMQSLLVSSTLASSLPSLCSTIIPHPPHPTIIPSRSPQKLLFSATLSLDPEHLSLLNLHRPKLFTVSTNMMGETLGHASLPPTLKEYTITCSPDHRPLVLLHLLSSCSHVLCFTPSRESAHRLSLLLQYYRESSAQELLADTTKGKKKEILRKFSSGRTQVPLLFLLPPVSTPLPSSCRS